MDDGFAASDDLSPLEVSAGGQFFLIRLPKDVSPMMALTWVIISMMSVGTCSH